MPSTQKYIPALGTAGHFEFLPPFDTQVGTNERYTLKSVRKISDFLGASEDVESLVYLANGIDSTYATDRQADVEVLGLQSDRGNWLYVPVSYVKCYPNVNGIAYRTVSVVLFLQPMPVDTDYQRLLSELTQVAEGVVGFTPHVKVVESSGTVLVSEAAHIAQEAQRALVRSQSSFYLMNRSLDNRLTTAMAKVYALEDYVRQHPH